MTFGKPGTEGARIESVESVGEILDIFMSYGHLEVCGTRQPGTFSPNDLRRLIQLGCIRTEPPRNYWVKQSGKNAA